MNRRARALRAWIVSGLCAALAVLGVSLAPAGTAAAVPQTWHVIVGAQSADRAIQTMAFYPQHIWVDQGDTVVWSSHAAEIHTVTFQAAGSPAPGEFNPGDMQQSTPQGTSTYDGHSYYNSGVLVNDPARYQGNIALPPFVHLLSSYRLTFPATLAPGAYEYLCLVHGRMMTGQVIVQPAGTPYPISQTAYNLAAQRQINADITDGLQLAAKGRAEAQRLARTQGPTVVVGAMDARVMVARFLPSTTTVRRGARVTFVVNSVPHTVTFGSDVTGCGHAPCNPFAPWNVSVGSGGNETANYPGNNGGYTGSPTNLNTGGMPMGNTLRLHTTKAGSYQYMCALHDYYGMTGLLRVAP